MSNPPTRRWRLQRIHAIKYETHYAPGLGVYYQRLSHLLSEDDRLPTLRSSIERDGIISPLIAVGYWDRGPIGIVDGFRRLHIARQLDLEIPLLVYDIHDLHELGDILRLRLSIHQASNTTDTFSNALAIYSAWDAAVFDFRERSYAEEVHILTQTATPKSEVTDETENTCELFERADIDLNTFRDTQLPFVHYLLVLQMFILNEVLKPSIARLIDSATAAPHAILPLLGAALDGASRRDLLRMKKELDAGRRADGDIDLFELIG